MTKDELLAFEQEIAAEYNAGKIRAPIHLSGGNEDQLIRIFESIQAQDWVFVQWRSHYHCLLKGVPPVRLKQEIMEGRSITLNFPEYRIFSSAIAGGHIPIALGVAAQLHANRLDAHVHCFVGDMTARMGLALECMEYAAGHGLPIRFIVESNDRSVCTATAETWGLQNYRLNLEEYHYALPWPHAGAGKRINF